MQKPTDVPNLLLRSGERQQREQADQTRMIAGLAGTNGHARKRSDQSCLLCRVR